MEDLPSGSWTPPLDAQGLARLNPSRQWTADEVRAIVLSILRSDGKDRTVEQLEAELAAISRIESADAYAAALSDLVDSLTHMAAKTSKLDVQGEIYTFDNPEVVAKEFLSMAIFHLSTPWPQPLVVVSPDLVCLAFLISGLMDSHSVSYAYSLNGC
jgi:hypothetical protein